MLRENFKWWTHKRKITNARHAGGTSRSSAEAPVMGVERRGCIMQFYHKENCRNTPVGGTEMIKTKPFLAYWSEADDWIKLPFKLCFLISNLFTDSAFCKKLLKKCNNLHFSLFN